MPSLREIRRRIRTVKNIQQMTNAMKMVAAARLRRAQENVQQARPYAQRMEALMHRLASAAGTLHHPLLEQREERRLGVVVFTSDRGLCGSYNVNILRHTMNHLRGRDPETVRLILLGRKGYAFFRRQPYPILEHHELPSATSALTEMRRISALVRQIFEAGEVDAVDLIYAQFLSIIAQRPWTVRLLPLQPPQREEREAHLEYLFEPKPEQLLAYLLPRYIDTQIYRALLEAVASEHGARMTAMSNATNNAEDMIERLTLEMNKARQASITKELTEIMGGVEALKS